MDHLAETSSQAPRVLLVHEPADGGVSQHVMHLAVGLGAHGFSVEVAGPRDSIVAAPLADAGITIHTLPLVRSYRRPHEDLRAAAAIYGLVRQRGIQLVHSHSSKAGALARVAALPGSTKSVYSPHGFGFVGNFKLRRKLGTWLIERALAPMTDAIVCVGEAERKRAFRLRVAPAARLHMVLNGVPSCQPNVPAEPAILELRRCGPVVGAVTALRPGKRVDVFLDAMPIVWRALPEAQFVIVGNGPLEAMFRRRASESGVALDPRFAFLPFSPPSARYLQSLDLFILASDREALPLGVLEAMACGVPQVASNLEGTREAIDATTGRVVPPGDPLALADALIELLEDPARRTEMSKASRVRHRERFTAERMVAEVAQLYRSLLMAPQQP